MMSIRPTLRDFVILTEFGLTGAGLEELYRIWIQKVPAEGDTSFQAFVNWLKENDDRPENGRAVRAGMWLFCKRTFSLIP